MPPRPIGDRPMTPAERQRKRRLRLSGGPAARLEREVRRALDAGLQPAEVAQLIAAIPGGIPIPADPASPVLGHETRHNSVTIEPPSLDVARAAYIAAIEHAYPLLPEDRALPLPRAARNVHIVRGAEVLDVMDAVAGFRDKAIDASGRSFGLGETPPERTLTAAEVEAKLAADLAERDTKVTKPRRGTRGPKPLAPARSASPARS